MKIVLSCLFFSIVISACNQTPVQVELEFTEFELKNLSSDIKSNCDFEGSQDFEFVRFEDNKRIFKMNFPKHWWTTEDIYSDIHGIVSTDTTIQIEHSFGIGITEIENDSLTLDQYFKKEVFNGLTKNDGFKIENFGEAEVAGHNSFWIYYHIPEDSLNSKSYLYYIQNSLNNNFYLIETVTYGENNIESRQCELRELIESFSFND